MAPSLEIFLSSNWAHPARDHRPHLPLRIDRCYQMEALLPFPTRLLLIPDNHNKMALQTLSIWLLSNVNLQSQLHTGLPRLSEFDPNLHKSIGANTPASIIGVPAIYGHPENTWTPRAKYFQDDLDAPPAISEVKRKLLELAPLTAAFSAPPQKSPTSQSGRDKPEPCWLTRGIRDHKQLQKARVLLYDHGAPEDDHTLKGLATRLLKSIKGLRAKEVRTKPPPFRIW